MKRILLMMWMIVFLFCGCQTAHDESPSTQNTETLPTNTSTQPDATETVSVTVPETTVHTSEPDSIAILLENMTVDEKVGQLFLARCPDVGAVEDIQNYHLGGYILFARDFENQTPDSVKETLQSYQDASDVPMLIAVDEEGGIVNRVSSFPAFRDNPFPSSRNLYAQGGLTLIESSEVEKCQLLSALGINVNVAPVCDVTTDPNAFMYARSLGQSPEITGEFVKTVVNTIHGQNMGGILKHFPGYGNNTDTHVTIAVDERPLEQLESVDLVPFAAGIETGCDAIMVSHTFVNALDPDTPASLSTAVHKYLREEMGFNGVIVTDDLVMRAITDIYGVGESAVLAVQCGNDLLCASDYKEQYAAVLQAVKDGRIAEDTLDQAVLRVLRWKQSLGLIQ